MKIVETIITNNGIRLELDRTEDDEGIYIWNCESFHDIESIEDLIENLIFLKNKIKNDIKDNKR